MNLPKPTDAVPARDAELLRRCRIHDRRGRHTLPLKNQSSNDANLTSGGAVSAHSHRRSSEVTAPIVGTSPRGVERIRTILDWGTASIIEDVESSKISIQTAYRLSLEERERELIIRSAIAPVRGDLGKTLLAFLRTSIPETTFVRAWNETEISLMDRLVANLSAAGLIETSLRNALTSVLDREKSRILGVS